VEQKNEHCDSEGAVLLEDQIRHCFGRVVYTHKTHEKCADILLERMSRIKLAQIILSAIASVGFISAVAGVGQPATIISGAVSVVLLALNTYTKNTDLGAIAQEHRQAAANLWLLREEYLSLITDLQCRRQPLDQLCQRRDNLLQELHEVYRNAPSTSTSAYRRAQKALQLREEMTFSEDELDAFLPSGLKRKVIKGDGA